MRLANRMSLLKTENSFVVLAKANQLEREGRNIIHLEIGDTDFDTPSNIINVVCDQVSSGNTHYCPSSGVLELREACCDWINKNKRGEYSPDEIVIGPGGKPFLYYTIMATAGEGDEVIYPDPGFPVYESVTLYAGAKPVPLPILEENNFKFTIDDLKNRISKNTRLLILNYPHNPTGGTLTQEELEEIGNLAIENDFVILSDEVYANMLFEGTHISIGTLDGMRERTILLETFSKTYAMTGWRLGFVAAPSWLSDPLSQLITNSVSCVPPFVQMAGVEALKGEQADSVKMMNEFKKRRDMFIDGLNSIDGISCKFPEGAFYAFPNVSEIPMSSEKLSDYLLDEVGVATLPGSAFGQYADNHLRMCFANSIENLEEAIHRISKAVSSLS
ncbi:MAG: pyridoxal phosphate-dependent aminotransferase [bacterium]